MTRARRAARTWRLEFSDFLSPRHGLRQAHVEAKNISVDVHDDQVVFSGQVASLTESLAAVKAAAAAPGVTRVVNKLLVA